MIFGRRAEKKWQDGTKEKPYIWGLAFETGQEFVKASLSIFHERTLCLGGMRGEL
jgi:hypothetical protein